MADLQPHKRCRLGGLATLCLLICSMLLNVRAAGSHRKNNNNLQKSGIDGTTTVAANVIKSRQFNYKKRQQQLALRKRQSNAGAKSCAAYVDFTSDPLSKLTTLIKRSVRQPDCNFDMSYYGLHAVS